MMLFRNAMLRSQVTVFALVTLCWTTFGGPAWAQQRAFDADPAGAAERLADDPRLNLTDAQRDALRRLAERPDAEELIERLAADRGVEIDPAERHRLLAVARTMEASLGNGTAEAAPTSCCGDQPPTPRAARALQDLGASLDAALGASSESLDGSTKASVGDRSARQVAREALVGFDRAHAQMLLDYQSTGEALRAGGLGDEVLERHRAAASAYREEAAAVRADLEAAAAGAPEAMARAARALSASTDSRAHQAYDPDQPPFAVARSTERWPGQPAEETGDGTDDARSSETPTGPAKAASSPHRLRFDEASPLLDARATKASSSPPTPADLAEGPEVQFTREVRDLAANLGGEPLRLYDWVRNEIDFYPTWGASQSAQRTLDMGRGNAADTASLLIALLRSSGVPARYVTGTIEVPVERAMNWLGGVASADVAQQLLGQGGVATVGLVGPEGDVEALRIEHVWVEAWIDNVPSRGAVQREGDTWLPLDAAFKQYDIQPPSEVFDAVPLDQFLDPADPPFTLDETLGRLTEIDDDQFDAAMLAYVEASEAYVVANQVPEEQTTVLGGGRVIATESTVFGGSLPYGLVSRDGAVAELSSSERHAVRLRGFRSTFDRALGSVAFDTSISLPALDAQRLSLQFEPATETDASVLEAARANGAANLPIYLVDVVPVVAIDGVEIARGGATQMGSPFFLDAILAEPGRGSTTVPFQVTAGDEIVVGVTAHGVSQRVIERRFAAVPIDSAPEYFHHVQLNYWAQVDYLGEVAASRRGVHPLRLPSVGVFSSPLSVTTVFGAPRSAVYGGRAMDVRRSLTGVAAADPVQRLSWVKQNGIQGSYLEGSVFEQTKALATGEVSPFGVSSIHVLRAAAAQGVPLYYITPQTAAAVQPLLQLSSSVERDIANALAAGKTVIAPERTVDLGPWRGAGYILQDEETGAAAYLISGGRAGGGFLDCVRDLVPVFEILLSILLFLAILALLIWLIASIPVLAPAYATAVVAFFFLILVGRGAGPTSTAA